MTSVATRSTISATFAREAADCLREGDMHHALELCIEGTRAYPDYAMGHVVLGKCYEAFGRTLEALAEYRRALSTLPDNPTVIALVQRVEEKERGEFQRFVAEQEKQLQETPAPTPLPQSVAEPPTRSDPTIEHLTKELERRRREKHPPASSNAEATLPPADRNHAIVTPTTAEIFAGQQLYQEALKIYRELAATHPGKYETRIRELERLAAEKADATKKAP